MLRKFVIPTVLVSAFLAGSLAQAAPAPESFADLAASLKPVVVNISTEKVIKERRHPLPDQQDDRFREFFGDEFFRRFFGGEMPEMRSTSLGSGLVWDKEGHIVTNNHVVEGADEIIVRFEGGKKKYEAKLIGSDPDTDIALLKIDAKGADLTPAALGDSDKTRVGDWVLAIGNPFGYGHTVTAGIVSAKERLIGSGPYDSFLQTDAAINPGNSGGPLFDMQGRVVGINTAIVSGGTGIGFAIPIDIAKEVVGQLKKGGKVTRGWLGVVVQNVTEELAESLKLGEPRGALVSDLIGGGPAEKAGIERGDVITMFDGRPVDRQSQLPYMVATHAPGAVVQVEIIRKGAARTITVTLGERKGDGSGVEGRAPETQSEESLGMSVQEITPDLAKHMDLSAEEGLVVTDVDRGGPAARAGIRRGDVIVEVNQRTVKNLKDYRQALQEPEKKESVLFAVQRGKTAIYVVVKYPKKDKK